MSSAEQTTASARTTKAGSRCPLWCVTDHERYSFHASKNAGTEAPRFHSNTIRALDYGHEWSKPMVSVAAAAGIVDVSADSAVDLANIIDQLADATPEEHRALARLIRECAALAVMP